MQLKAVTDQENMDKVLDQDVLADAWFEAGFNTTKVQSHQKDDLIQKIAKHYIIFKQLEEIQSCSKGMKLGAVLNILLKHKTDAISQFPYKKDHLSTKELLDIFSISYSQDERNRGGCSV